MSIIIGIILIPIGILYGLFNAWYKKKFWYSFKKLSRKFLKMAEGIDRYGNIVCGELFNATLVTRHSRFPFGNGRETISSCLGRNKQAGTLTRTGKALDAILEFLDPGHSINNIGF